jgi:RNA polymerase sigma factor (TIGR02999 family)
MYMMSSIDGALRLPAPSERPAEAGQARSLEDAKTAGQNYNQRVAPPPPAELTGLLRSWRSGDPEALARLMPLVYSHLRAQARRCLRREAAAVTLQSTALVHELYLRLRNTPDVDWHDRAHFFALSARIMRRILVDAARARAADKRGGAHRLDHTSATDLDQFPSPDTESAAMLCALGDALECLARVDPRRAHVIELRFFGGFSVAETAELLQVSPQTVMRDWRLARIWLAHELTGDESSRQ